MTVLRLTKRGAGKNSGEDWPNAAGLASLGRVLGAAREDTTVLIGFDRDREDPVFYSGSPVILSASGTAEKPIRLTAGYIGNNFDVQPQRGPAHQMFFKNSGASLRRAGAPGKGNRFLTLANGASHLRISGFRVEGATADGFVKFSGRGSFDDIVLEGMGGTHIGRFIECDPDTAIGGLIVENCDAFGIVRGFGRFRSLTDAVFRNLFLDAGHVDGGGSQICQIIHVEKGRDVTFENVVVRDAVNLIPGDKGEHYAQGDGIVTEAGTASFVLRNCHASGMGDGGFDLKTVGVTLEDCSASRCKFGMRIWSRGENMMRRCAVESPHSAGGTRGACVQVRGTVDVIDSVFQAGPHTSVFAFNGNREATDRVIRVFGGSVRLDAGAALVAGVVHGKLELHDVAVNGTVRNETHDYGGKELL
jgi:hypothetical protein